MANWLHQLQSLLGQQGASPSGESSKGSGLLPGAIGGLAGLLVASKSSRKLLAKYGTSALLALSLIHFRFYPPVERAKRRLIATTVHNRE